jgi:hypothetical protein
MRGSIRRRLIRRFPYALLYRVKPTEVRILAVMNLKRRPAYWVAGPELAAQHALHPTPPASLARRSRRG